MADRHRLGTFTVGGRFTTVLDIAASDSSYAPVRDTFKVTPPAQSDVLAKTSRRYGGSRRVAEIHDNGQIELELLIQGVSQNDALVKLDALLAIVEDARTQYFYEWRPDSATYSTYFELRGTAWEPQYSWVRFAGAQSLHVKVVFNVAPLGLGDPLDIYDDFSVDSIADYTFDAGAAGNVSIAGGVMTAVASLTTENTVRHTARGYTFLDHQETRKFTPGATVTGFKGAAILRGVAATTRLEAYVDDDGVNSRLRIDKVIAGARTNLVSANLGARISNGTAFFVRGRSEGNLVFAEYFTSEPTPSGTPTSSVSVTLSSAEQTTFVAGAGGWAWIPQHASATMDEYRSEPYTYRARSLPDTIDLKAIPGTAPAKFDCRVGVPATTVQVWSLIGWVSKPAVHNMIWNGDFEDPVGVGVSGWLTASAVYVNPPGVGHAHMTNGGKFGQSYYRVTTSGGSVLQGRAFFIYQKFRKGVTYTASAWLRPSVANAAQIRFGNIAGSEYVTDSSASPANAWTLKTVTWTPTADYDGAVFSFSTIGATAETLDIDGAMTYEGTVAPTIGKHAQGAGAYPPFGLLQAEAAIPSTLTNWTITASGGALGGYYLNGTSATSFAAEWMIDPSLVVSDDFSQEVVVDVYVDFINLDAAAVSTTVVLSAIPESNAAARIHSEWGSAGRSITIPSAATASRVVKLGALTFPVDSVNASRWRLKLAITAGVSTTQIDPDYLILVPRRQFAAGHTAKPNDSSYPAFFHSGTVEEVKTVRSDLSGLYQLPPGPTARDSGLGGQLLEMPPGDVQALLKLSNLVPDDPTSNTTSESPLSPAASVHFAVRPCYQLTRSS